MSVPRAVPAVESFVAPGASREPLDVVEGIIHGVALREPERLVREEFAVEVTDMLVRYLVRAEVSVGSPRAPTRSRRP